MKKLLLLLPLMFLFSSCSKMQKGKEIAQSESTSIQIVNKGEQLMKQQCYVCHNPATSMGNRVAPPMVAIRMHYLSDEMSRDEFVNTILAYVKNPTEEKSRMPGAVRKFGLMPQMVFKDEDVVQIANYLFEYEPAKPEWFDSHFEQEHGKGNRGGGGKGQGKGKGKGKRGR